MLKGCRADTRLNNVGRLPQASSIGLHIIGLTILDPPKTEKCQHANISFRDPILAFEFAERR